VVTFYLEEKKKKGASAVIWNIYTDFFLLLFIYNGLNSCIAKTKKYLILVDELHECTFSHKGDKNISIPKSVSILPYSIIIYFNGWSLLKHYYIPFELQVWLYKR
jgi:hypothetical protein